MADKKKQSHPYGNRAEREAATRAASAEVPNPTTDSDTDESREDYPDGLGN